MDPVQVGFKETKEVLDAMIALGKAIEASMEDDKLTLLDVPNFIPFLTKILPAIEGVEQVPFEFKVADPAEIEELKTYLKDNLDLEDDQLEAFIEDSFKVALDIFMLVKLYFLKDDKPSDDVEKEVATDGQEKDSEEN